MTIFITPQKRHYSQHMRFLIQEGLLSVTSTGFKPLSQACPGKSVVRLTDLLDMTIAIDLDIKPQLINHSNAHAAKGLNFGLSHHVLPYFLHASSENSGLSAYLRRLA